MRRYDHDPATPARPIRRAAIATIPPPVFWLIAGLLLVGPTQLVSTAQPGSISSQPASARAERKTSCPVTILEAAKDARTSKARLGEAQMPGRAVEQPSGDARRQVLPKPGISGATVNATANRIRLARNAVAARSAGKRKIHAYLEILRI